MHSLIEYLRYPLAISILLILVTQGKEQVAVQVDRINQPYSKFREYYEHKLKENSVVGSSLLLMHDGKIVARERYGLADKDKGTPVDENTIFHLASVTKTFTGIAIMQLRDHGKLNLDDPVDKYLPELRVVHNPFGKMSEITIRHLLSHTAGFQNPTWPWGGDKDWHPLDPQQWTQVVSMLPYTQILFKPGSKYGYSNPAYVYLAQIIERLSGDDFEVFLDKNILKPLGMHSSFFDTAPYHLLKHRSHSYNLKDGKLIEARFDFDTGITVGNGGLNAPVPDMTRYLNFLIGDSQKADIYDGVLKRSSLEEMWLPQFNKDSSLEKPNRPKLAVGLSFLIQDRAARRIIGHDGNQNGFLSDLWIQPESRTAIFIAYNTEEPGNNRFQYEITSWLFENIVPLF